MIRSEGDRRRIRRHREGRDRASAEPRQRDVRKEGPALRVKAGVGERAIDFPVQSFQRRVRTYPDPQGFGSPPVREHPERAELQIQRPSVDAAERSGDIVGLVAVDLADETDGQMELGVVLPTRAGNSAGERQEMRAHGTRRTDGDEETMHCKRLTRETPQRTTGFA